MPVRTCVGCRRRAPAGELVRVVAREGGGLVLGRPGRDGRGAWVCADRPACVDAAGPRGFTRALRRTIGGAAVAELRAIMAGRGRMVPHARAAIGKDVAALGEEDPGL